MNSLTELVSRTFLIERVASLLVYVLVLLVVFNQLKLSTTYKQVKRILNIYLIIIVVMAYFFVPDGSKDLTRILANTNYWEYLSLEDLFKYEIPISSTPLGTLYVYFCRRIGSDRVLPALTAFLFFNNSFYILKNSFRKLNCTSKSVATALLVLMSTGCFLEVISDIRCFLAFSIVARAIFNEICLKKKIYKNLPFYIAAALIHLSVVPVIAIRFLFYVMFESDRSSIVKLLSSIIIVVTVVLMFIYNRSLIDAVFTKANSYLTSEHYSYSWEYIIGFMFWTLFIYILWKGYKRINVGQSYEERILAKLSVVFLIIELMFSFEYNIFHRYILVSVFIMMPFLCLFLSHQEDYRIKKLQRNIQYACYVILLLVCMRGNLCGYKFFVL